MLSAVDLLESVYQPGWLRGQDLNLWLQGYEPDRFSVGPARKSRPWSRRWSVGRQQATSPPAVALSPSDLHSIARRS